MPVSVFSGAVREHHADGAYTDSHCRTTTATRFVGIRISRTISEFTKNWFRICPGQRASADVAAHVVSYWKNGGNHLRSLLLTIAGLISQLHMMELSLFQNDSVASMRMPAYPVSSFNSYRTIPLSL